MAFRARFVVVTFSLALLSACAGEALGEPCSVSADCDEGTICVGAVCVDDGDDRTPGNEGEGETGGEGEGEIIIGGEGEGEVGEGEGETGEGEGEGETGEGEGEGEPPPPVCEPGCSEFQQCDDGTCEYVGVVCDTFANRTIGMFAQQTGTLNAANAELYEIFDANAGGDRERFVRNHRITDVPDGAIVKVTVASGQLDPILLVLDDRQGQCAEITRDDDGGGDGSTSRLDLNFIDGIEVELAVTSVAAADTGDYTIRTRPLQCGLETVGSDGYSGLEVYEMCRRGFEQGVCGGGPCVCGQNNPCAIDADGTLNGFFCCAAVDDPTSPPGDCGLQPGQPMFLEDFGADCGGAGQPG